MKDFKYYLDKINEKSFNDYPFQLYHSKDNMATAKGFNSKEQALKYALDNKIEQFDIFKNGTGFHSTTQDEFLVLWADKKGNGYFSNRSKKEPELLKKKYEINEKWDPSMSNLGDEPWNQTSFVEQNEDMLEYLENKLGYSKDDIEDFMSGNGYNAWETDMEAAWSNAYGRTLIAGYDDSHDTAIYNDAYKKIDAKIKKLAGTNYKKYKYELKKALDRYVVDNALEELRNVYLNHIPKNESTTFNVPTLIQLYYVEDANKKAVGLYKDLETAEKLEMQSKGKKYIINIDRAEYNSGKINASNAKYYVAKNESGELVPVQAGEIIKLQKPAQDTYTNKVMNSDGIEIADCTICGAPGVIVTDHICKTIIAPTDQVPSEYNMVENRFESIRNKYGVNESKMITKIDWFKAILESPEPEENKHINSNPKSEISMSEQEIANEVDRLFDRYNNDEINADIRAMFPDYKTTESEDATYYVIDTIYDNETISDITWKALKPGLLVKFKKYFENNTLNESFNMSNFVILPNGDLEININGIEADVLAEMNLYQGTDEQFLWQFFESNLTNGYHLVPDEHKGLTEAPMISDEFIDEETDMTNVNVWAFMDYMVVDIKEELLTNGKVIFKKV